MDRKTEHKGWVELYNETVRLASSTYPEMLSEEQRDAYMLLPDLIERCQESYHAIPEPDRPLHWCAA